MIKNFSYTIPTIGRISIGERVESDGKVLPKKLNHFCITAQYKLDGRWALHPVAKVIAEETQQDVNAITEIPVAFMFNDPDLSVRERFEAFDDKGRMVCAGNGACAKRVTNGKIDEVDCVGPDHCKFGRDHRCKLMTRLNVQINVRDERKVLKLDPMSSFILRSSGFNTARTLAAKLKNLHALFGEKLVGIPFRLKLLKKSSAMSRQSIFYYADIVPEHGLIESMNLAKSYAELMESSGLDQDAFENAVRAGLENGAFEDTAEDFADFDDPDLDQDQDQDHEAGRPGSNAATGSAQGSTSASTKLVSVDSVPPDDLTEVAGLDALRAVLEKKAA